MKPDNKPSAGPARERDVLRARNTRALKAPPPPGQAVPSCGESSASSSSAGTSASADVSGVSTSSVESSGGSSGGSSGESSGGSSGGSSEMKVYLDKLRELVPYVPRSGRVSKVQLIHSAIDYITDLQESLEARARRKLRDKTQQAARPPLAALPHGHHHPNTTTTTTPLMENTANRLPTLLEANTSHPAALNLSPDPLPSRPTHWLPPPPGATSSSHLSSAPLAPGTSSSRPPPCAPAALDLSCPPVTTSRGPPSPSSPGPPLEPT